MVEFVSVPSPTTKVVKWSHKPDIARREQAGRNLMLARTALGKTRMEWCDEYGLYHSKLSNWEAGVTYPALNFLILLCDRYNLSLDFFYRNQRVGAASSEEEVQARLTAASSAEGKALVLPGLSDGC